MFETFWQNEIHGQIATWLASIGTLAAVVVALWLAWSERAQYVRVSAGIRLLITPGEAGPRPECLAIRVVNQGRRPVKITGIGWRSGRLRKRHAFMMTGQSPDLLAIGVTNPPVPITLADGEEATWFFRLDTNPNWIPEFVKNFCPGRFRRLKASSIRVQTWSSTGNYFWAPIEQSLRDRLIAGK